METEAITDRPSYPPKPVGVAIKRPGERAFRYLAWGHPVGNNCTRARAAAELREVWRSGEEVVFHNSKFDCDVAETHFGLPLLPWHRRHDTMFSAFLLNPYARLNLKETGQRELGRAPTERDALRAWVIDHVPEARKRKSEWGAYISRAPGDLVGRYAAQGDAATTLALHRKLYPQVLRAGMGAAYDRERRLLPYLLAQERGGLRVDARALARDIPLYAASRARAAAWLLRRLKAKDLNLDSNEDLAQAILRAGLAREEDFLRTKPSRTYPAGQMSVAKESLAGAVKDQRFLSALGYYSRMGTCLGTFMEPWLRIARETGGTVHPKWHQVRTGYDSGDNQGARSGRLITSDPNLLNLAKSFEEKDDGYAHPAFIPDLLPLPLVRRYVLPDPGGVFLHRDYNQQELRILAHFAGGALVASYRDNPAQDLHVFVQGEIQRLRGVLLHRRSVKTINFGILYGMGVGKLAGRLATTVEEARTLKTTHRAALPDVATLERECKRLGDAGECTRTWGGRRYYAEPPIITDEGARSFAYKLLNYKIQGSAADNTKEALIRYHEHPRKRPEMRFLVTVYDEVNSSAPKALAKECMAVKREAMESVEFDVFMKTDGKRGSNWGTLKDYKD